MRHVAWIVAELFVSVAGAIAKSGCGVEASVRVLTRLELMFCDRCGSLQ
ncbi:hypothetical protein RE6C_04769 [Rhodopirellula europaea 6C]|uniref:Uncharacterized protein n=1 Tax=Rhodopirellula europaea 6C TaxID=1263867 RepID=M2ANP9_9BACT|nr:hypothetical protein RE6C_04769 [Rhodopirellula europaea 6C]